MLLHESWKSTWNALGVKNSDEMSILHAHVLLRYSEKHRFYHTVQHLEECAARLEELQDTLSNRVRVSFRFFVSWLSP